MEIVGQRLRTLRETKGRFIGPISKLIHKAYYKKSIIYIEKFKTQLNKG